MDAAALLFLALALVLPSGYSAGAVMLLLLGLAAWPALLRGRLPPSVPLAAWAGAVALMGAVWAMHILDADGRLVTSTLGLDRCLKYALVLLLLPALLVRRPAVWALGWGCALGAGGAGLLALWQVLGRHMHRAEGFTNAIQFGNLALLLGLFSAVWAMQAPATHARWAGWAGWAGAALGLAASVTSGSRGGWVTLPVLLLLALGLGVGTATAARGRHALRAVLATVAVCALLALVPGVQQRAEKAADEYQRQEQRADDSSIGLRLAFWRQAWADGLAAPWVGVGQSGYEQRQRAAVARDAMPPQAVHFNHAHNEWLDMFAKRGLLGVLGLLMFYAVPLVQFARALRVAIGAEAAARARRAAALCGLITVLGFAGFGMTQVMFSHNNGNMMYLLCVSLWLAVCWHGPGQPRRAIAAP